MHVFVLPSLFGEGMPMVVHDGLDGLRAMPGDPDVSMAAGVAAVDTGAGVVNIREEERARQPRSPGTIRDRVFSNGAATRGKRRSTGKTAQQILFKPTNALRHRQHDVY
jgi:hypothetical protein